MASGTEIFNSLTTVFSFMALLLAIIQVVILDVLIQEGKKERKGDGFTNGNMHNHNPGP